MNIIRNLKVPTGNILIVDGENGQLECLSIGDYGKAKNLKADCLGLYNEINGVPHGNMVPLEEKWVITISTQYGCSMGCPYCDVPKVGPGKNATLLDLIRQVNTGLDLHPEVKGSSRLNIHFARMGEPTWNPNVLEAARRFRSIADNFYVHPVVSTMMPKNNQWLKVFIHEWMSIKNDVYGGNAGLQISLNSTDEEQRKFLFNNNSLTVPEVARVMAGMEPVGRKITLNVALAADTIVDPAVLLKYFDPRNYIVKITPMHETHACKANDLHTPEGYDKYQPYKPLEEALKSAGYDVLVFIPSIEEDEGLITCGNAILSGSVPRAEYEELRVEEEIVN